MRAERVRRRLRLRAPVRRRRRPDRDRARPAERGVRLRRHRRRRADRDPPRRPPRRRRVWSKAAALGTCGATVGDGRRHDGAWTLGCGRRAAARAMDSPGPRRPTARRVSNDDYESSRRRRARSAGSGPTGRSPASGTRVSRNERGIPGTVWHRTPTARTAASIASPAGVNDTRQLGGVARSRGGARAGRAASQGQLRTPNLDESFAEPLWSSVPRRRGNRRLAGRVQADVASRRPRSAVARHRGARERARARLRHRLGGTADPGRAQRWSACSREAAPRAVEPAVRARRRSARADPSATRSRATQLVLAARRTSPPDSIVSVNPRVAVQLVPSRPVRGSTRLDAPARRAPAPASAPPDAFEIAFTDNPELEPERSRSFDVGIEQAARRRRLDLDATASRTTTTTSSSPWTRRSQDASQLPHRQHLERARAGLEARVARLSPASRLRAWPTRYLDTEILVRRRPRQRAPTPFAVGDPLLRRPVIMAVLDVPSRQRASDAFARARRARRTARHRPELRRLRRHSFAPGYAMVDAGGACRCGAQIEVFGRALNLFDREYEEALRLPALGRSGMVGVQVAASR